ncbi:PaaI family thioesterase [Paenibacillus lentus]|uniref:PaaI family thioesterase n=1 Tax=Paenibacillus lentus TaxID=1338368 RepID=A0A3S8RXG7_9BACL|nr:PaaI family thioesterase [Paenibacillus lentus]AZK47709.1 PaaI family thioesterase [Paenibacillus lentus]
MDWTDIISRSEKTFWGMLGLRLLSADSQRVEIGLTATESHLNSMGIVHGGVLSSMMDQAMGTLVTATKGGREGVTTHLNVNFLSPMTKGELIVTAYPLHETFRTMTLRAEVHNSEGILGCISTATFRLPKAKTDAAAQKS